MNAPPSSFRMPPTAHGKIIAVHLNYASRAAQRGRRPATPSYFYKPTSSLARTGGTVTRPDGCELLAFEGEIALIIDEPVPPGVALADAWHHVGWITAANDLGLHDFRAPDRGSNVRSKGRDGFTPLGSTFLDARLLHPENLRVRTWLNGDLVQEDTTATLLFPLAQIVADLAQHCTLERGDIILTGTPAGASVLQPGDVVEVEVDAPGTTHTTGRLSTAVARAAGPGFNPQLGALPVVDDVQRAEAWGSPEAAGITPVLSDALRSRLARTPVAALAAELRRRGFHNVTIDGVRPLRPEHRFVGTARTLRLIPHRTDLFATHGGGHNAQKQAFDAVRTGEVLVIEARGDARSGTLGDILAARAHVRGAAAIVTDGGVRDADAVAAIGLPVYSAGAHPSVLGRLHVPWDLDVAIACGGCAVVPGDILVGDADGVVVIPAEIVAEVADAALAQEEQDGWIADRVAEGHPIAGLFPMNPEWKRKYEAWRTAADSRR